MEGKRKGRFGVGFLNDAQISDEEIQRDFSKYGPIINFWKGSKTLVFVNFKYQEDAEQCLSVLSDSSFNGKYGSPMRGKFEPVKVQSKRKYKSINHRSIPSDSGNTSDNLQYNEDPKSEEMYTDELNEQVPVQRKFPKEKLQTGGQSEIEDHVQNNCLRYPADSQQSSAFQRGSFHKQFQKMNISSEDAYHQDTTNNISARRPDAHINHSNGNSTTGRYQGRNHGKPNGYDSHDQNDANLYKQFPATAPKKALLPTPHMPLLSSTNQGKEYDNCDGPPPLVSSDAGPPPLCSTRSFRHEYDNCDVHFNRSNGNSTTGRYQGSNHGRLNGYDSHDQNDVNLYKQFPAAAPKKALLPTPHMPLLSSTNQGKEYDNCDVPPPLVSSDAGPPPLCSTRSFRHECSILLANIPLSITPTEVYEIFATLAPVYVSPVYKTDHLHLPFCLIKFQTPNQARKALDDFDDTLLYGKHVLIRNLNELHMR